MFRLALAALAALTLAACLPPSTTNPVGTTVGFKSDASLIGLWRVTPETRSKDIYYCHFLNIKDGAMFAILVPSGSNAKNTDVLMFKLKTARLGKFGFLNALVMQDPEHEVQGGQAGTWPVLYRFDAKDNLEISLLDKDATKDAIRTHKIAGKLISDTIGTAGGSADAVITADGATLDKFFRSRAGLSLFKNPAILTRVR